MPDPKLIQNRATSGPPEKLSPFLSLCASVESLVSRVLALESRPAPVAVKGDEGRGISAARLNSDGELVIALSDGIEINVGRVAGKDGENAKPVSIPDIPEVKDGVGVATAVIDEDGHLIVALTDGRSIDAGRVRGKDGVDATPHPAPANGVGIANAVMDAEGCLILSLSDGRNINVGKVKPNDGEPGKDADPAKDGASVQTAIINDDGHLIIGLTDGKEIDAGLARGKPGKPGDSVKGDTGRGISKAELAGTNLVLQFTDGTRQNLGRVVGNDGAPGKIVSAPPPVVVEQSVIEIGEAYRANITAKDLDTLMFREVTINGETFQLLSLR